MFRKKLLHHLKRITDTFSNGMHVFTAAAWLLLKITLLCVVAFIILSLVEGGEPFYRLSQKIDQLFVEKDVYGNVTVTSGFLAQCGKGVRFASDTLADNGDRILEIRMTIVSTKKEREEAGEKNAEDIKRLMQLKKESENGSTESKPWWVTDN